jgi:hypothetical protein
MMRHLVTAVGALAGVAWVLHVYGWSTCIISQWEVAAILGSLPVLGLGFLLAFFYRTLWIRPPQ